MTKSKSDKKKRNVAIACGRHQGMSLRALAVAFALSPARVVAILADLRDETETKCEQREYLLNGDALRN